LIRGLTISLFRSRASPQGSTARLIIGIDIGAGAGILEVRVVLYSGGRASSRSIMGARATVPRVALVSVKVCKASRLNYCELQVRNFNSQEAYLATNREPAAVIGSLKRGRAIWAEVNRTFSNLTSNIVGDTHGQVIAIDQAHW
jgi:hypothetical protein